MSILLYKIFLVAVDGMAKLASLPVGRASCETQLNSALGGIYKMDIINE
jgi:hypothetical protein